MSPANGARILVVDDEPAILRVLRTNLNAHGFSVEAAETGSAALMSLQKSRPDLIILDLGLPDIEGGEIIRSVRTESDTPIIVLSVRGAERDKVRALDLGADDYLTKPFGVDELLARIRVALRHVAHPKTGARCRLPQRRSRSRPRTTPSARSRRRCAPITDRIRLAPGLRQTPGQGAHRPYAATRGLGPEYGAEDHYLHVYVARIRKKIEADQQRPQYIVTAPGVGYRFNSEPPD